MANCARPLISMNTGNQWSNFLRPSYLCTLVKWHPICYTYNEIALKGKPPPQIVADTSSCMACVARRGPLLRPKTFVWGLRRALRSSTRKLLSEVEAKLKGPSYPGGQPVAATECVSFDQVKPIHPNCGWIFFGPFENEGTKNPCALIRPAFHGRISRGDLQANMAKRRMT